MLPGTQVSLHYESGGQGVDARTYGDLSAFSLISLSALLTKMGRRLGRGRCKSPIKRGEPQVNHLICTKS